MKDPYLIILIYLAIPIVVFIAYATRILFFK